jgi:DNA polymerase IV (family X)
LPFALLHFTSGAEYAVSLRTHANSLVPRLRLSERGLFLKDAPSSASSLLVAESEQAIFARLRLKYEEPWERFVEVTPLGTALLP